MARRLCKSDQSIRRVVVASVFRIQREILLYVLAEIEAAVRRRLGRSSDSIK
jgi:hypothetical protein